MRVLITHNNLDARKQKSHYNVTCNAIMAPALCRWLRRKDLNQRPSGYEPDELPGCSTPRYIKCNGAGNRARTGTGFESHGILSPGRLPISPLRHNEHPSTDRSQHCLNSISLHNIFVKPFFKICFQKSKSFFDNSQFEH